MADKHDFPLNEEVLAAIQRSQVGIAPRVLVKMLRDQGHTHEDIIGAVQMVLDQGLVDLTDGARLMPARESARAAA